jgi:hypothetical protein
MSEMRRSREAVAVIERGLQTFVEVGNALLEIRDSRLYRESHGTFEQYCRERWGWGRNYVNKQIAAAEVANNLGTFVPKTEAVARELAGLDPEQQREIWDMALVFSKKIGEPTAREVRMAELWSFAEANSED